MNILTNEKLQKKRNNKFFTTILGNYLLKQRK